MRHEPEGELCGLRIKPAEGLLLEVPADETRDEVLAESRRWGRTERRAPQGAKLVEAERPHAVDLGLDRLAIGASHAGHAALRPDLLLRFGATSLATMR